jgi:membrane-bound serine protease (ClpP class)
MIDFLMNPNVAYLMIVAGFLLTVFAILTPGTGLFEIGAVFALLIVGYQVYSLPVNVWALIVLAVSAIPFIFALRQKRVILNLALTTLAFVVGSVFMFNAGEWWQPAVHPVMAFVVSVLGGGFFYLMAQKTLDARAQLPSHDLGGLIGAIGEARTDIHAEGSVYVARELWTAFSDKRIKAGSSVKVIEREGLLLKVKEIKNENV